MISEQYWEKRSIERLVSSEKLTKKEIPVILDIYDQALKNIDKDIKSIYSNYSKNGILDVNELKKALNAKEKREFLKKVSDSADILGLDKNKVFDSRYLSRVTRLQALQIQMQLYVESIAPQAVNAEYNLFGNIIQRTYKSLQSVFGLKGAEVAFSTLDKKVVDAILRSKWVGGNYSSRIWNNTDEFAKQIRKIIGGSLGSGQSYEKTSRLIRERFSVSKNNAMRLVITETNYHHNQAELQSYTDNGFEKYKYLAKLDGRTSSICRNLNGKTFKTSEAKPGKNYPTMHPYCRSTTIVDFSEDNKPIKKYPDRIKRLDIGASNAEIQDKYQNIIIDSIRNNKK